MYLCATNPALYNDIAINCSLRGLAAKETETESRTMTTTSHTIIVSGQYAHAQYSSPMEVCNGSVQWKCAMEVCNGSVQWKCTMEVCNGSVQWKLEFRYSGSG